MRIIKNILARWHIYVSWAILTVIFWGWIFTLLTDTTAARKLTVFVHTYACEDEAMSLELEKTKPDKIRMIKVHPFSYAMFGETGFTGADVYIIPESDIEGYLSDFTPIYDILNDHPEWSYYFTSDGVPYGIKVYDAESGEGIGTQYLTYAMAPSYGLEPEDYYLFIGSNSVHIGNDEDDSYAFDLAETIMNLK